MEQKHALDSLDSCRVCLLPDENCSMQALFKDFSDESCLIQKIEVCGGIKLEIRDDLPRKICQQCMFSLNVAFDFRNLCQTTDLKLRNICVKEKIEIKDEPQSDRVSVLATPETVFSSELSNDSSIYNPAVEDEEDIKDDIKEDIKEQIKEQMKEQIKLKTPKRNFPGRRMGKKPKPKEVQVCELCGNVYARPSRLLLHMRRHAAEKPFSCEICNKKFTCQSEINRHMRTHTGVKPFQCKYCDRRFSDRSTNIKHERTHTNERPFVCSTCGKAFTYSNVLKNHMLTHTGEKPFRSNGNVRKLKYQKHPSSPGSSTRQPQQGCDICDKTFSRTHQLKQHYLTIIHQQKEAKVNRRDDSISNSHVK